jgi:site-specific recombinase XerD
MANRQNGPVEGVSRVWLALRDSYKIAIRGANKAEKTEKIYLEAVDTLAAWLVANDMATDPASVKRQAIEGWLASLYDRGLAPATVNQAYRALQQWWKWLVEEDEIENSPMAHVKPPYVPDNPVEVVPDDDLEKLLKACAGTTFTDRRNTAIISLFYDCGARRTEIGSLALDDLDFDRRVAHVTGKRQVKRPVPFGRKTAERLDRYIRVRARHRDAEDPALWLGHAGPMTPDGIYQVVSNTAKACGLHIYPHKFRHTFSDEWLSNGGNEGDLMMINGWKSRSMLSRYGASAARGRALDNYAAGMSPLDRLSSRSTIGDGRRRKGTVR